MSTAKEILEKQLEEIQTQRYSLEEQMTKSLSDQGMGMMKLVGLEPKSVYVSVERIQVNIPEISHWSAIEVKRQYNWDFEKYGKPKYGDPTLDYRGGDISTEVEFKYIVSVGEIANHFLNKTMWFSALVELMDQMSAFKDSEEYKMLRKQENELERIIHDLIKENTFISFISVFNKGKFKLNKTTIFTYGSGRFDYVKANEWEWVKNGEGKTYTLFYFENKRSNPLFDENGNSIEGEFEKYKYQIPKRIKKADMESFIRNNISLIEK